MSACFALNLVVKFQVFQLTQVVGFMSEPPSSHHILCAVRSSTHVLDVAKGKTIKSLPGIESRPICKYVDEQMVFICTETLGSFWLLDMPIF